MEEASLWMQCNNCGEKHRRYPTEKPVYSARKCNRCQCHHAAKEVRNYILYTILWVTILCMMILKITVGLLLPTIIFEDHYTWHGFVCFKQFI